MPVEYRFEPDVNLVTVTLTGTIRFDDIAQKFLERIQQPEHRPGMNILMDGREALLEFSTEDVTRLVTFLDLRRRDRGAGFRFALTSTQDLAFALGRMFEAYAARLPEDIRVFRDLDDARRWVLGAEGSGYPPAP
ncbi:MAG TPA: STAS/SEC14 domain-containing protein [Vicinamibacterales bacterium]|nr:STAS/SEC14 domain-containing protein [Vicinamibacterales bacterium]